jgi:hypothetical protein
MSSDGIVIATPGLTRGRDDDIALIKSHHVSKVSRWRRPAEASHPAEMVRYGEDVFVAAAAHVHHHQMILWASGGELHHLG